MASRWASGRQVSRDNPSGGNYCYGTCTCATMDPRDTMVPPMFRQITPVNLTTASITDNVTSNKLSQRTRELLAKLGHLPLRPGKLMANSSGISPLYSPLTVLNSLLRLYLANLGSVSRSLTCVVRSISCILAIILFEPLSSSSDLSWRLRVRGSRSFPKSLRQNGSRSDISVGNGIWIVGGQPGL